MDDVEELERALDYPWEQWTVFLHPAQRQWVERDYDGPGARLGLRRAPARPSSRCTGPCTWRARNPDARVLLTTFSDDAGARAAHAAATAARQRAAAGRAHRRASLDDASGDAALQVRTVGKPTLASRERRSALLDEVLATAASQGARDAAGKFSRRFLLTRVGAGRRCLAARQLGGVPRRRPPRPQDAAAGGAARGAVVDLRARAAEACRRAGLVTRAAAVHAPGRRTLPTSARSPPFDFAVVDEAQDLSVAAAALPRRARRRTAERPVLRRRPRPAHLPAAVLVEGARRRRPRPLAHAARQLPDVAPDPQRRPTGCSGPR